MLRLRMVQVSPVPNVITGHWHQFHAIKILVYNDGGHCLLKLEATWCQAFA